LSGVLHEELMALSCSRSSASVLSVHENPLLVCEPVEFYVSVASEVLIGVVKKSTIFDPENDGYILRRNIG
jgi:hypothetical protein